MTPLLATGLLPTPLLFLIKCSSPFPSLSHLLSSPHSPPCEPPLRSIHPEANWDSCHHKFAFLSQTLYPISFFLSPLLTQDGQPCPFTKVLGACSRTQPLKAAPKLALLSVSPLCSAQTAQNHPAGLKSWSGQSPFSGSGWSLYYVAAGSFAFEAVQDSSGCNLF